MSLSYRLHSMEMGASSHAARAAERRRQGAARRRALTASAAVLVAVAVALKLVLASLVSRALAMAAARGEPCGPLVWPRAPALVLSEPGADGVLWNPRYVRDDHASDLIRARETSAACPQTRMRVRQARVSVAHARGEVQLSGKAAVCAMHYIDFIRTGEC